MATKGSEAAGPLVVELIGALCDDHGAFARTVVEVLAKEGLDPRPGSLDQVAGASARWALATLLEGHGRDGDRLADLEAAVTARWLEVARSGRARILPEALAALHDAAQRRPVAVLTALPEPVVATLVAAAGVGDLPGAMLAASGEDGPPRSGALSAWLDGLADRVGATALLATAPAALAALGARMDDVVVVGGEGGAAAAMLTDRHAASVEAALAIR